MAITHEKLDLTVQGPSYMNGLCVSPDPLLVTSGCQDWRHGISLYRDPPSSIVYLTYIPFHFKH